MLLSNGESGVKPDVIVDYWYCSQFALFTTCIVQHYLYIVHNTAMLLVVCTSDTQCMSIISRSQKETKL